MNKASHPVKDTTARNRCIGKIFSMSPLRGRIKLMERRYGQWAGNPKGNKEDLTKCIEEVWKRGCGISAHQCSKKRGYGPQALYCKQHSKKHVNFIQ